MLSAMAHSRSSRRIGASIVLLPGGAKIELDESLAKRGVIFTDLRTAEQDHPDLIAKMIGKTINVEEGKFAALAGAFSQNGVVLYVPKGVIVEEPLHSILWGPGANLAHVSHILVLVDEGASVTYVHESASPDETGTDAMHAGIVEIQVLQDASLKFVELQSWGRHVWNFSHERIRVERGGNLDWIFGAIGSRLTKNFSELDLAGEGAQGRMSGFYFTDGNQHLDHDTQQNHLAPHTTSDLLFKGAVQDQSKSVYTGLIRIRENAKGSNAFQTNRNLTLSAGAWAESVPNLDIETNDVKCSHASTVGPIDEDQRFYLESRGVRPEVAERLVVLGFFDEVLEQLPAGDLTADLRRQVAAKLNIGESAS